jgi:hypothetical protein
MATSSGLLPATICLSTCLCIQLDGASQLHCPDFTKQCSNAAWKSSLLRSLPMKTILHWRGSPSRHLRSGVPSKME